MESWHQGRLTDRQAEFVARWFPDPRLMDDMSWNLVDTVVLDLESWNGRVVVKAYQELACHQFPSVSSY